MKKLLFVFALLLTTHAFAKEAIVQKPTENTRLNCKNQVAFGDINICLPKLPSMKECYSDPLIKIIADLFKGAENEQIIGFYLSEGDYKQAYENFLEEGAKDPYIKMFSYEELKGVKADNEMLDWMKTQSEKNYDKTTTEKINERFKEKFDADISLAKPILLETYQITPNSYSEVVLLSYRAEGKTDVQVGILTYILIKERFVGVAYYEEYNGMDKVSKIKSKNDFFILSLNSVN